MKKLTVIDLDGTLYRGSTLKRLYRWAIVNAAKKADVATCLTVGLACLLSLSGIISRRRAKHTIMKRLEASFKADDFDRFAHCLTDRLDSDVTAIVEYRRREGDFLLLSTASPTDYCRPLARILSFDLCHSTDTTDTFEDYIENRSERKRIRAEKLAADHGLAIDTVVTDHHDDIPLFRLNRHGRNILVNPSAETTEQFKKSGTDFKIITTGKRTL